MLTHGSIFARAVRPSGSLGFLSRLPRDSPQRWIKRWLAIAPGHSMRHSPITRERYGNAMEHRGVTLRFVSTPRPSREASRRVNSGRSRSLLSRDLSMLFSPSLLPDSLLRAVLIERFRYETVSAACTLPRNLSTAMVAHYF